MGPPAGCSWVPWLPVSVGHGGCEPGRCSFNTQCPARHLLEGRALIQRSVGARGDVSATQQVPLQTVGCSQVCAAGHPTAHPGLCQTTGHWAQRVLWLS